GHELTAQPPYPRTLRHRLHRRIALCPLFGHGPVLHLFWYGRRKGSPGPAPCTQGTQVATRKETRRHAASPSQGEIHRADRTRRGKPSQPRDFPSEKPARLRLRAELGGGVCQDTGSRVQSPNRNCERSL